MAERIQLKEPGSEFVMTVSSVSPQTVERNDYYLFTNGKVELLVPQSSVKAQLERLDITDVAQMIGKVVRFGRSMKMSRANKPFWDIDWAGIDPRTMSGAEAPSQSAGGEMGKPTVGTSASAPSVPIEKPKMREAYKSLTEWVLTDVSSIYNEHGFDFPPEVAAACVQTLFIQACYAGKVE